MLQKPTLTLVKVGPKGLTLEETLELFRRLSGREPTPHELSQLQAKMEARAVALSHERNKISS